MTAYPGCAGLARSPFVLTEHISSIIYIYMYGGTYAIIVAHDTKRNVGGIRPQPFIVCASRFRRSNQWKRHGH